MQNINAVLPYGTAGKAGDIPLSEESARDLPLVVDLDGTLVKSDTLIESLLLLVRTRPLDTVRIPLWLVKGRAGFKRSVTDRAKLDASTLPFDERLLSRLENERSSRALVLCTAADARIADAVAAHLRLFDEVIATSDAINLKGSTKANALIERFGAQGFDYAGNDVVDIPVFNAARRAWIVNPTAGLQRVSHTIENTHVSLPGIDTGLKHALRALRPHQWVKNLLVFIPMFAAAGIDYLRAVWPVLAAFVAFCVTASSVYLVNDLLDLTSDRVHPRKRLRPIAAGALSPQSAALLALTLLGIGFTIAGSISLLFTAVLAIYFISSSTYTIWLKRVPLLDTMVLAGLYTLRIIGGAAAASVVPSFWLLAFSMFFFLSLALAKRYSELVELEDIRVGDALPGRGYRREDLTTIISQGSASGYSAVVVLALYVNSDAVRAQYAHPELVALICPLLLYWINKLWLNSQRREIKEDPVLWAMSNRVSRGIGILSILLLVSARWLPRFY